MKIDFRKVSSLKMKVCIGDRKYRNIGHFLEETYGQHPVIKFIKNENHGLSVDKTISFREFFLRNCVECSKWFARHVTSDPNYFDLDEVEKFYRFLEWNVDDSKIQFECLLAFLRECNVKRSLEILEGLINLLLTERHFSILEQKKLFESLRFDSSLPPISIETSIRFSAGRRNHICNYTNKYLLLMALSKKEYYPMKMLEFITIKRYCLDLLMTVNEKDKNHFSILISRHSFAKEDEKIRVFLFDCFEVYKIIKTSFENEVLALENCFEILNVYTHYSYAREYLENMKKCSGSEKTKRLLSELEESVEEEEINHPLFLLKRVVHQHTLLLYRRYIQKGVY